jgi:tetratricopeptide (TPR) repeat protein
MFSEAEVSSTAMRLFPVSGVTSEFAKFVAVSLLCVGIGTCARAQISSHASSPTRSLSIGGSPKGTITVYIRGEEGEPLSVIPNISLSSERGRVPGYPQGSASSGWVFSDVEVGDQYEVDVKADGYQPASQSVTLVGSAGQNADVIIFLRPLDEQLQFHPPGGQFILAPRAQKEVEKGLNDLRAGKIPSAQKHFQKAITMASGNPYVNYVMGMSYLIPKQFSEARPYLEKSVSIDPKQPAALLALGTLRFESADYAGAIQTLNEEVQLDSSWRAEWTLAASYLHQRDFAEARSHAEKALAAGKEKAAPVQLVLGQALAGLGDRSGAVKALQAYQTAYPKNPNAAKIQIFIENLEKAPAAAVTDAAVTTPVARGYFFRSSSGSSDAGAILPPAPTVELPPRENWAPVDVDAEKPFVISSAACPLAKVLDQASKNTVRLVSDLEKFTATEEYQTVELKRNERLETPEARRFSYIVYFERPRPQIIETKEVRNSGLGPADMPGRLADVGAPGLVLAFHPDYRDDFHWQCEGLGEWKDQPAWVLHFEQRSDRPTSLLASFDTPSQEFALPLKGRVWVSTKTGQVVRLEDDLVHPIAEVDLKRQHSVIEYAPVSFASHKVTLWLPESVDVYIQYQGHYLHHQHQFSNFQLFWVGTSQKIAPPQQAGATKQ